MLDKLALNGRWQLRPVDAFSDALRRQALATDGADSAADWLTQELPAHWQQLPELEHYAGKVLYRRRFAFSRQAGASYRLRLNGVFYWSTIWLNGVKVGENEGYFFAREYDVTAALADENTLLIEVDCPDERQKGNKRLITGVFSHWDCLDPATNPGGIWLPVELISSGPAHLTKTHLTLLDFDERKARVRVSIGARGAAGRYTWRLVLTPNDAGATVHSATGDMTMAASDGSDATGDPRAIGEAALEFDCANYRLWWTHDTGPQNLYRAEFALIDATGDVVDRVDFSWGMRLFSLDNYRAYLNKKPLFIKGSNYGPGDTRIATVNRARADEDLRLAKECHLNLLRVHAHVDHPALYEAADEAGVLLWQDFPLQWRYRPSTLPEALRQARLMVESLHNHPAIVVWCMHNEPIPLLDTKDETFARRLVALWATMVYSWDREVMDSRLKAVVQSLDSSRFVQRSSGEFPVFGKGGDTHLYFGWYGGFGPLRSFDRLGMLLPKSYRFVTEFGAQSFPNLESSVRFMDADIERIDWRHLEERHSFQPEVMSHWYPWRSSASLPELIERSQAYQSMVNRYYVDRLRFAKYRPTGGIVPFMFHDPNPAVQWSVVDYWRRPKRSYHDLRLAFTPAYAFTLIARDEYTDGDEVDLGIYVINDAWQMAAFTVRATLTAPDGSELLSRQYGLHLPPDCGAYTADHIKQRLTAGVTKFTLTWEWNGETLVNEYALSARLRAERQSR